MVQAGYYPPPPPAPGLSRGLSIAVQVLFWIDVGIAAVAAIAYAAALSSFVMMRKPSATLAAWQRWVDQDDLAVSFLQVFILAQLPIMVVLIIWTFKSHRAATLLEPGRRRWAIGWSIGSWFIPLATYVLPFFVIRETDAIASAPRVAGKVVPNWREYRRPSVLGAIWWLLFVLMTVLFLIRPSIWPDDVDDGRAHAFYIVTLVLLAVGAASAAFGALYIRSVSRRLSPQAIASGFN